MHRVTTTINLKLCFIGCVLFALTAFSTGDCLCETVSTPVEIGIMGVTMSMNRCVGAPNKFEVDINSDLHLGFFTD